MSVKRDIKDIDENLTDFDPSQLVGNDLLKKHQKPECPQKFEKIDKNIVDIQEADKTGFQDVTNSLISLMQKWILFGSLCHFFLEKFEHDKYP